MLRLRYLIRLRILLMRLRVPRILLVAVTKVWYRDVLRWIWQNDVKGGFLGLLPPRVVGHYGREKLTVVVIGKAIIHGRC